MARRNAYLRESFHEKGLDAVRHAQEQFDELAAMPIPEALKAAKQLPEIFTEAIVIGHQDPQIAHDRLRSHFYINEVISLNDLVSQAKRKRFSNTITRIKIFFIHKPVPISTAFKGISKPIEPQSLSVEMDLMLDNILAAHAPTAAISAASSSI